MIMRTIHRGTHHFGWDNSVTPVLRVASGETLEIEATDSSAGQYTRSTSAADVPALDFARVNPVNGPVFVEGAEPGDALQVELLDFQGSGWGWTAMIPGFGLLAEDFPQPEFHVSAYTEAGVEFEPGIRLPFRPFAGTIGVAPALPGLHSIIPPREVGGNLDIRDLTRGARLWLPVASAGRPALPGRHPCGPGRRRGLRHRHRNHHDGAGASHPGQAGAYPAAAVRDRRAAHPPYR